MLTLFLAVASTAPRAQVSDWVSAEWLPVTGENERSYQAADERYKAAVQAEMQRRKQESRKPSRRGGDRNPDPGATAGGSSMGNMGIPGMSPTGGSNGMNLRVGSGGPAPPASLEKLLPGGLEFAAPTSGGLIVQRTRNSVLFGRTGSDEVVFLPWGGQVDLVNGARASVKDEAGQLRLTVILASGQEVDYRYRQQPDASGQVLGVDIRISGIPGGALEFTRLYRRSPAR
jgi:hypothetical protein